MPPLQIVPPPELEIVGSATTVTSTAFEVGSAQPLSLQFLTTLYQRVPVSAPLLYVLEVAPLMLLNPAVELVDEISH